MWFNATLNDQGNYVALATKRDDNTAFNSKLGFLKACAFVHSM